MKKIAVTGANGNIGSRLVRLGAEPLSFELTKRAEVEEILHGANPDLIVHLGGKTSVDWCENNEYDAMSANVYGTGVLLQCAANTIGEGKVVLISSDQVFDGTAGSYQENDKPNPVNVYGRTKEMAEGIADLYDCKIVRVSRCFDEKSSDISGYLHQLRNGMRIHVPDFIYRSYCHFDLIAETLYEYALRFDEMPNILHLAGSVSVSFFDLMYMIADRLDCENLVYPRNAVNGYTKRPFRTGLDVSLAKSLGLPIPVIGTSIDRMIQNERL